MRTGRLARVRRISTKRMRPALFLDRDGVINVDHGYVYRKDDFHFKPGIFDLCRYAKEQGYLIFVVTNQAGIGRGHYTEADFHELTRWMCEVFKRECCAIDKVYFCPSHPEHGIGSYKVASTRRKPGPGMILEAVDEFEVDLKKSVLVGDKMSDIKAGNSATVRYNILLCGCDTPVPDGVDAVFVRELTDVQSLLICLSAGATI